MKVYMLYRSRTESEVAVDNYLRLFADRQKASVELMDVDSRQGDGLGRLYAIMSYPSVVVVTDDGQQVELWHGKLPTVAELTPYLAS